MNKNNAKDYLPLVQALADGKNRQLREYEKQNAKNAGYTVEEYTRPCTS